MWHPAFTHGRLHGDAAVDPGEIHHRDRQGVPPPALGLRIELGDLRAHGSRALADGLADALRHAVRGGRLPAGTRLPASRSLVVGYGAVTTDRIERGNAAMAAVVP